AVGSAATASLNRATELLALARARGVDLGSAAPTRPAPLPATLPATLEERRSLAERYVAAYRRYCWKVTGLSDLRLAPFHLLASEGQVHTDKDHLWHMATLARLASGPQPLCLPTAHLRVALDDPAQVEAAVQWWLDLTGGGGEGMVIKPLEFV